MPWFTRSNPPGPQARIDPELGELTPLGPATPSGAVHWEGEWLFPPTGTTLYIGMPGDSAGPAPAAREFLLGLPYRFSRVRSAAEEAVAAARPEAGRAAGANALEGWRLSGFNLEAAGAQETRWSMAFDALGGDAQIFITFSGETPCGVELDA